jgi:hypothetical protein
MKKFKDDYAAFDEDGMMELRCMNCGVVVGQRDEIQSKRDPSKMVLVFRRRSNFRQPVKLLLSDGSYIQPILCADAECENAMASLTDDERTDMEKQFKSMWVKEKVMAMRDQKDIDAHVAKVKDLKIVKKL